LVVAKRPLEPAHEFSNRGHRREQSSWREAEPHQELAGRVDAVPAEPAEELLGTMRRHEQAEHESGNEQPDAEHLGVRPVRRVHVIAPLVTRASHRPSERNRSASASARRLPTTAA
jgi:hypothetical protein